jgi:hypothetical protein
VTVDAGHIDGAVTIAGKLNEGRRIELGRKGEIYGNAPAGTQMEVTLDVAGDELGRAGALDGRHVAASRPESLAECCAVVGWARFDHEIKDPKPSKKRGVTRMCRCEPLLSNQSNKWDELRQVRLSARGGLAQCCLQPIVPG